MGLLRAGPVSKAFKLSSVLASAIFAAACAGENDTQAERSEGTSLVLSGTKPGVRLDPHMDAQWEVIYVLSAVYDTLVETDENGETQPRLASAWRVSADGLSYTFDLRNDISFHDGAPFNAAAVKFNFDRIRKLGPQSLKARSLLPDFETVEIVSPFRIRFVLTQPDSSFLYSLSLPYLGMVSPQAAERWGDQYHHHQAGTGAFAFAEYNVGEFYRLQRNRDNQWQDETGKAVEKAIVEEVVWRFLPEPSTRSPALASGDIDIAFDLDPVDAEALESSENVFISRAYLSGQPAFWFINAERPPTDDIRVRQAILYGADMDAAVKAITRGYNPRAFGPLSAVTPGYSQELQSMYNHDPAKARALLEAAGWVDEDGDGVREKEGRRLTIEMSMVTWGKSRMFSELLYSQLRSIGIDLKLEMMDFSVQMEAGRRSEKNMLFMGGSGHSAADSLRGYFHSDNVPSGFAWSKFADPEIDAYLNEAVLVTDRAVRDDLYGKAQMRIMEQALILPIYDYVLLVGVNNRVEGLKWGIAGLAPNLDELALDQTAVSQ
ncbi:ABC transporter substrate-binding protein [Hyphococcus sp.]|uniref:ABC transporter substrate-binding protein n=1 Tax=Hyphococcus sp. TaxID=2038636 RepID=UPI003CCBA988